MRKGRPSPNRLAAAVAGLAVMALWPVAGQAASATPLLYGDVGFLAFPPIDAGKAVKPAAPDKRQQPALSYTYTPAADLPVPVTDDTVAGYVDPLAAGAAAAAVEPHPNRPLPSSWSFGSNMTAVTLGDQITAAIRQRTLGPAFQAQPAPVSGGTSAASWRDGAFSWALSSSSGLVDENTTRQSLSAILGYDLEGGHQLSIGGSANRVDPAFSNLQNGGADAGWQVGAGANINLADVARFNVGAVYGQGPTAGDMGSMGLHGTTMDGKAVPQWGANAGLSFDLSQTVGANMGVMYQQALGDVSNMADPASSAVTAQANVYWQPLNQMRLGWQVMWGEKSYDQQPVGNDRNSEELRTQIGAWFHF
ncbi:MAG: hypothetical protein U1E46_09035 [Hyphomicrobiales bacterium]